MLSTISPMQSNKSPPPVEPRPATDIKSVMLTFRVLFELAKSIEAVGVSELARRLGEGRAAVHKHLITLRGLGVVMQGGKSDRYRLGWKLVELGQAAEAQSSIVGLADASMRRLRDASQLTAFLEQASGAGMVVSHAVPSESGIAVTIRKGLQAPTHGSAGGRVMLAFSPKAVQDEALSGELPSMSERMLTNPKEIRQRLARIHEQMFDSTAGESPYGIHSLAAPVLDEQGNFVASVGVLGTGVQIKSPPSADQVRLVQLCAASISRAMGSDAYDRIGIPGA